MDGTIIDSTQTIVKHWNSVAEEIGVDSEFILATCHGRRSVDVLKVVAPEKATWEYYQDVQMLEARSVEKFREDVLVIPGARPFLEALSASLAPWAIVTSGTEPAVNRWIETFSLPKPDGLVTAESVTDGKPDPTCYQMGLSKLGLRGQAGQVLVLSAPSIPYRPSPGIKPLFLPNDPLTHKLCVWSVPNLLLQPLINLLDRFNPSGSLFWRIVIFIA
ncbi:hypothetical protein FDECE_17483 [Fusarium decemcellulare]|nr:hypothetical protein FDECE_17483 [Fusarium decemcellulare]